MRGMSRYIQHVRSFITLTTLDAALLARPGDACLPSPAPSWTRACSLCLLQLSFSPSFAHRVHVSVRVIVHSRVAQDLILDPVHST